MVNLLRMIYHKFSRFKIIRYLAEQYNNGFLPGNIMAYYRLKRMSKRKYEKKEKIVVVFLCQYGPVWNKLKSVYEKMQNDERFENVLLAIPEDINNIDMKIYDYFHKIYGDKVINAYDDGKWIDLKNLNPDYVFYQRPYDQYLPASYRSNVVAGYAKVCHVAYGYQVTSTTEVSGMCKRFFRNVYIYFAENNLFYKKNVDRFKKSHREGIRRTINVGYPALEDFMKSKPENEIKDDKIRILWTPRWTEDKENGGSSFVDFKDKIFELLEENENINLIFRPHPMTFQHFIDVGKLTKEEAKEYKDIYDKSDRMIYDDSPDYAKTFWESDILLTDVSTIIVEYFLTGKPIIYCDTGAKPNYLFAEMLNVFYVVNTWEEAKAKALEVAALNDPLKEKREKKIKELIGDDFEHVSERFLDEIYKDYNQK